MLHDISIFQDNKKMNDLITDIKVETTTVGLWSSNIYIGLTKLPDDRLLHDWYLPLNILRWRNLIIILLNHQYAVHDKIAAYDVITRRVVWTHDYPGRCIVGFAVWRRYIVRVVADKNHQVDLLHVDTGDRYIRLRSNVPRRFVSGAVHRGHLYLVDKENSELIQWHAPVAGKEGERVGSFDPVGPCVVHVDDNGRLCLQHLLIRQWFRPQPQLRHLALIPCNRNPFPSVFDLPLSHSSRDRSIRVVPIPVPLARLVLAFVVV